MYRNKGYTDPLLAIEDKVGTRIVLLTTEDVENASNVISDFVGWNSKVTKDIKKMIEDCPDQFNYQSIHIVVSPKSESSKFTTDVNKLTCEIQIRTLLQHAYSEISHDSTYKGPFQNDKEIMRSLAKSMALMEATDDYFCKIFLMMSDEQRKYHNYVNELIFIYQGFRTTFSKSQLDFELTKLALNLIDFKDVTINQLKEFVIKRNRELSQAIKPINDYLFEQPVCILLSYYFFNHRTFLKEEWPFTMPSLKNLYKVYSTAFS